jgi:tRNA(adenine34) deaminase
MNAVVPTTQSDSLDAAMMRRCLQLSEQSVAAGERPFGALLAAGSVIVAAAGNRVEADGDVTRHAEVVALAEAQRLLGKKDMSGHTLYSIVEPCAMCSFAIRECGIQRVVYALGRRVSMGRPLRSWPLEVDASGVWRTSGDTGRSSGGGRGRRLA